MTKQHFIALAEVLQQAKPVIDPDYGSVGYTLSVGRNQAWEHMREALANFCAEQNPRFNRERWLGYIAGTNGPNGGKV